LINWEQYCNSCLCHAGVLNRALYVCTSNNLNHPRSVVMPTSVHRVGKCTTCKCTISCKQV
jgi:hypothetical protein